MSHHPKFNDMCDQATRTPEAVVVQALKAAGKSCISCPNHTYKIHSKHFATSSCKLNRHSRITEHTICHNFGKTIIS